MSAGWDCGSSRMAVGSPAAYSPTNAMGGQGQDHQQAQAAEEDGGHVTAESPLPLAGEGWVRDALTTALRPSKRLASPSPRPSPASGRGSASWAPQGTPYFFRSPNANVASSLFGV